MSVMRTSTPSQGLRGAGHTPGLNLFGKPWHIPIEVREALPEHRVVTASCRTSAPSVLQRGSGGPGFKSRRPDQVKQRLCNGFRCGVTSDTAYQRPSTRPRQQCPPRSSPSARCLRPLPVRDGGAGEYPPPPPGASGTRRGSRRAGGGSSPWGMELHGADSPSAAFGPIGPSPRAARFGAVFSAARSASMVRSRTGLPRYRRSTSASRRQRRDRPEGGDPPERNSPAGRLGSAKSGGCVILVRWP
jgi:hypothetical protein